ncbi:MAG TPA: hypothetical protein PLP34_11050, partial [Chitinophagaceae bacterium]|nr:hypothetical protein [Chitinophagaceae bacterium]
GAAILIRNAAVYVTGSFWGSADFDPGPALHYLFASSADDIFLLSLDTAGNYQWAFNYGSTGFNSGSSLGVNAGGDIYCSGYFNGTVDFDPSASISALTSAGSTDVFIICNDSNGVFKWARNFGGNNDEEGYMQVQLNGSIYVTGSFGGSADFDPSGSVYALTATGLTDLYQLKLAPCFSSSSNSSVSACDSYSWNGNTYTTTGNYVQYLTNATGCDSLLQLQLTIHNNNNSLLNLSVCDSMVLNGNTYTLSGNYIQYYTNSYGCDSNIYLGLQVNYSSSSTQNITACDTYNWNGNNYTLTGSYIQTISNTTGCDSTMLLNLVIHPNSSSSQAVTSCSTYQWNGNNYSVSGTYLDTLVNVAGCDSLMSLQLNI